MAKAKTINLLLEDGNLEGLLTIEDSSWDGIMFVSPRESVDKLFQQEETSFWGVYLLISENEVYIGQASELQRRIKQHDKGKDFWKKAVLITTKDDSLNRSAIDYIEHELIEKSQKAKTLHSENKQAGNKAKVSRFDKVKYDNFIENSLLLLELIGIKVFTKPIKIQKPVISKPVPPPKSLADPTKAKEQIPVFIKTRTGADARGIFDLESQKITILKGSKIADETKLDFKHHQYDKLIQDLVFKEELSELPPSRAAEIIVRTKTNNGWITWRDEIGNKLDNYRKEIKK